MSSFIFVIKSKSLTFLIYQFYKTKSRTLSSVDFQRGVLKKREGANEKRRTIASFTFRVEIKLIIAFFTLSQDNCFVTLFFTTG